MHKVVYSTFALFFLCYSFVTQADTIKPTLVEVSIYENHLKVEFFTNIEAIITGIGTQYKNSIYAPNAAKYDKLRHLSPDDLLAQFSAFESEFLKLFHIHINDQKILHQKVSIHIDDIGYTKRPRISRLVYSSAHIDTSKIKTLAWQFDERYGDNALRFRFVKQDEYTWQPWNYLKAGDTLTLDVKSSKPITTLETLIKFISIGFKHVIPLGLDHILFIITIALGITSMYRALIYVSSFTIAHTATLGLATYQVIEINPNIIEPIIALSIVIMACNKLWFNIRSEYSGVLIFIFGLIHGLGFALMLREFVGEHIITSLVGFNIGVELAQILIILLVLLIFYIIKNDKITFILSKIIALSIVIIGMIMLFERII